MKKLKILLVALSVVLILLELLPFGAVFVSAKMPGGGRDIAQSADSYFSFQPFGDANFFPFVIAVLSCVLLCLVLVYALKNRALAAIKTVSLFLVLLSLSPVVMGVAYFSVVGVAIAVAAFAVCTLAFALGHPAKQASPANAPQRSSVRERYFFTLHYSLFTRPHSLPAAQSTAPKTRRAWGSGMGMSA